MCKHLAIVVSYEFNLSERILPFSLITQGNSCTHPIPIPSSPPDNIIEKLSHVKSKYENWIDIPPPPFNLNLNMHFEQTVM